MASVESLNIVQDLYIAYYQRPGDPSGLLYWADRLDTGTPLVDLEAAFGNAQESQDLYGPINSSTIGTVIDEIYLALFNRAPDPAGKQFYIDGFNAGTFTPTSIAYNILVGATGDDAVAVVNKQIVADRFSESVDGRPFSDPNFGQGSSFNATYEGEADAVAARAMLAGVTSDPASILSESQVIAFIQTDIANPGDPILNEIPGVTFNLTTGLDDIQVPPGGATDLVKGFFTDVAGSTLTPADSISGNGATIFKLSVDINGNILDTPFFEMSGVNQLNVVAAGGGTLTMDGSTLGDIGSVNLSGADGLRVRVEDVGLSGDQVDVSMAGGTGGSAFISGTMDGLGIWAYVSQSNSSSASSLSLSTLGIELIAGNDASVYAELSQTSQDAAAKVSVGSLAIASVDLTVGSSGWAEVSITNNAYNSGTGTASVGNLTIGDVSMAIGSSATGSAYFYNSATAVNGAATVGDLTIGDIDVTLAATAAEWLSAFNSANATKGNGTAGNLTVGNVTVMADDGGSGYIEFTNSADAFTSGNAKVGDITVGDVSMTGGSSGTMNLYVYNFAYAAKGSATAGNLAIGDVSMAVGDSGSAYFSAENTAYASAGAATIGNSTVGDIDLVAGVSSTASVEFFFTAQANAGAAKVGNVTIGDVDLTSGVNGDSYLELSVHADGTSGDSVGNTKVGAVNLYGSADAFVGYSVSITADNGTVGDVTLGDVKERVENNGSLSYSVEINGEDGIGNVQIGNVDLSWGSGATLQWFNISVSASGGDIASFKVGNISISTEGVDALTAATGMDVYAEGDIGDVTLGNISINMVKLANFSQDWTVEADSGSLGNIQQGNITLMAATSATADLYQYFSAEDEIGNATVGNITLSAAKEGTAILYHEIYNSDDIGNITYGNISLTANGKNSYAYAFLSASNDDTHDIGTITAGNVNMTAKGDGADATLTMSFTSADTIGAVQVGNITMELQNTKAGAAAATGFLNIYDAGGASDLTLGDFKLTGNTGVTAVAWALPPRLPRMSR